jgi:hypothetical protein
MAKATENMREATMVDFILIKTVCRFLLLVSESESRARMWKILSSYIADTTSSQHAYYNPMGLKSHRPNGSEESL